MGIFIFFLIKKYVQYFLKGIIGYSTDKINNSSCKFIYFNIIQINDYLWKIYFIHKNA